MTEQTSKSFGSRWLAGEGGAMGELAGSDGLVQERWERIRIGGARA